MNLKDLQKLAHYFSYLSYELCCDSVPNFVPDHDKYYHLGKNTFIDASVLQSMIPLRYAPYNDNMTAEELLTLDKCKKIFIDSHQLSKCTSLSTEMVLRHPLWSWDWKAISQNVNHVDYRLFNNVRSEDLDIDHLAQYSVAVLDNDFRHRFILPEDKVMKNEYISWSVAQKMNAPIIHFAGNPNMTADIFKNNKIFHQPDAVKILINNPCFSVRELSIMTGMDQKTLLAEIDQPTFDTTQHFMEAIQFGYISPEKISSNFMISDSIYNKLADQLNIHWKKLIYNNQLSVKAVANILSNHEVKESLHDQNETEIIHDYAQIFQHGSLDLMTFNYQASQTIKQFMLQSELDDMTL